jgi:hypothetical protein
VSLFEGVVGPLNTSEGVSGFLRNTPQETGTGRNLAGMWGFELFGRSYGKDLLSPDLPKCNPGT